MINRNHELQKTKVSRRVLFVATAIMFALIAVFGLSLLTGNEQQSNIGSSAASALEPADINNDNKVDVFDLSYLLGKWNTADTTADLTKDGTVNVFDLSKLLSKWGAVGGGTSQTCPPYPSFPDASCTGVPSGVSLTNYTGPCTIHTDNTVIDAKIINCNPLQINGANVQVTRSRINGTIYTTDAIDARQSVSISDSEIVIGSNAGTGIGDSNWSATRVEITGGNRSANCWHNCTIQDSYVHAQFTDPSGTFHESGIRQGANGVIRHNNILCDAPDVPPDGGCSADLTGYGDFATVHDMTVDQNYFGPTPGGYCAYGGSSASKPYPNAYNMRFTNNVFARAQNSQHTESGGRTCAYYGTISDFNINGSGNVWTNNKYTDGGIVNP